MSQKLTEVGPAFGQLSVAGNVIDLSLILVNVWYQYVDFTDAIGESMTLDLGQERMVIDYSGWYYISVNASFSGTASQNIECSLGVDGVPQPAFTFARVLDVAGVIEVGSFAGLIYLPAGSLVTLLFRNITGGGTIITGRDVSLTAFSIQRQS